MHDPIAPRTPFRWDLVTPDQLGTMLDGVEEPQLWFQEELVQCAAKVLARSANGDLFFVGRSLDSMYDFLSGALADTDQPLRLQRLPFSFQRPFSSHRPPASLPARQQAAARQLLSNAGVTPHALARRSRPATLVDVVHSGSTFGDLFTLLADWTAETREPWDVISKKVRFVGVTERQETSPKTWRWQQHADWTSRLPARAFINVSLDARIWSYFADQQTKLTRTFRPESWLAVEEEGQSRDKWTRYALAQAVALVSYGRSSLGRRALARGIGGEPALAEPWLRSLVRQLNGAA